MPHGANSTTKCCWLTPWALQRAAASAVRSVIGTELEGFQNAGVSQSVFSASHTLTAD